MPSISLTRHTRQRRLVLTVLKCSPTPLTAEQVARAVRRGTTMSVSTVYRNLDLLANRKEIFRLSSPDGVSRFAGTAQPQMYFTCTVCGATDLTTISDCLAFFRRRLRDRQVLYATTYLQGRCHRCRSHRSSHARR